MASEPLLEWQVHRIAPPKMTYKEFLEWSDEDDFSEWVDGEVIWMGNPSHRHQNIAKFLASLFTHFVEAHDLGEVFIAPFQMKLALSGREPDVIFLSNENSDRLERNYVNGPADLVVEVVSPDSVRRDRVDKFGEYALGGIREYWILDPDTSQADFFALNADGAYEPIPLQDGRIHSCVLDGLWLEVDWLWREPLPKLMSVLQKWELV